MTKRSTSSLCAAALSILALTAACSIIADVEDNQGPNDCSAADQADPLACHLGACHVLIEVCGNGAPASCPTPSPQEGDLCNDGIDNNCDGQVDEACPCEDGQAKPCYTGAPITRQLGACRDGVQACQNGVWGQCQADVLPAKEICDQLDNDCDGAVDESGCPCTEGQEQLCYGGPNETINIGVCKLGTQTCTGGAWGDCKGDVTPRVEQCDGVDNNCDGVVDTDAPSCDCPEGDTEPCYGGAPEVAGIGECVYGSHACQNGVWGPCEGYVLPKPEICNVKDDDCNNMVDDGDLGDGLPCNVPGVFGPCQNGSSVCGIMGVECQQVVFAQIELCDGADNDCDGIPDNGNPGGGFSCLVVSAPQPLGECAMGVVTCEGGELVCLQVNLPSVEVCDGFDNDCNGTIDDGNLCCIDLAQNGTETDTDCGGPCVAKCTNGKKCIQDFDCQSNVCTSGFCQVPTCNDLHKNGTESDVDCGGPCPFDCLIGQSCNIPGDCASGVCIGNVCIGPGCADGVKNGTETDTDCGGAGCSKCADGRDCIVNQDCWSARCAGSICQVPTCNDSIENGTETDADCGGSCTRCQNGQKCLVSNDCLSSVCASQECATPTCADLTVNGSESDVDCGGVCPIKCAIGEKCDVASDCATNICTSGFCAQKAIGSVCLTGTECGTGQCVDGVCCNSACSGLCVACTNAKKGSGADGICAPIGLGADPDSECSDQGAISCGTTGFCDGAGDCQRYPFGTTCSAPVCQGDGVTLANADRCNGTGSCVDFGATSCAPSACVNGACTTTCQNDDSFCAFTAYCNGLVCISKKIDGAACGQAKECLGGTCIDGVCCNLPCNGPCEACSAAKKGPGGGPDGACGNVGGGLDPDSECAFQNPATCGTTGFCGGFGSCQLYAGGSICVNATCSPDGLNLLNADNCNGNGVCLDGGIQSCGNYVCSGGACLTSCPAGNAQCAPTAYCNGAVCFPKKGPGEPCVTPNECASNVCTSGFCT